MSSEQTSSNSQYYCVCSRDLNCLPRHLAPVNSSQTAITKRLTFLRGFSCFWSLWDSSQLSRLSFQRFLYRVRIEQFNKVPMRDFTKAENGNQDQSSSLDNLYGVDNWISLIVDRKDQYWNTNWHLFSLSPSNVQVSQQAISWIPLSQLGCHPDTQLFLCSLFTPV